MSPALGGLAVALALTEPSDDGPRPSAEPRIVAFEVGFLEFDGLGWREDLVPAMTAIDHPDGRAIWTADAATVAALKLRSRPESSKGGDSEEARAPTRGPRIAANAGNTATLQIKKTRHYVARLERKADGPPGEATWVAFVPGAARVDEGCDLSVSGEPEPSGGMRVRAAIRSARIAAVHTVAMTEAY